MGMNKGLLEFSRSEDEMERIKLILDLGSEHTNKEVEAMAERVRVIFAYRAELAQKILENKHNSDPEIDSVLVHMIEHYNEMVRDILAL